MNLGLPKRVLAMATDSELEEVRNLVTMSKRYRWQMESAARGSGLYATWSRQRSSCSSQMRYWRLLFRKRYAESFTEGLYRTTRKSTYGRMGPRGNHGYRSVPKRTLMVWIERNELGWNFFMLPCNEVVRITGTDLDGVMREPAVDSAS